MGQVDSDGARRLETLVQIETVHGGVHLHAKKRTVPLPRMTPGVTLHFTDREPPLRKLLELWQVARDEGVPLVLLFVGPRGIGKSELAAKFLRRIAGDVPGPHLYADMDEQGPVPAKEVLGRFLRALGVEPAEVPPDLGEMTGLFRSLTSDRPPIVFLDDVTLASQVRPLVPNSAGGVVVVTARNPLENVPGMVPFPVGPLDEDASAALLKRVAGVADDVDALVGLCGGRPSLLCAAALRVALRGSARPVVAEIGAGAPKDGDDAVMAVYRAGYDGLEAEAARVYRCLGALLGRSFSREMAAAAAGTDDAGAALGELVYAGLVEEAEDGFRLNDLALEHARSLASEEEHEAALRRVVRWYLRAAVAADYTVMPGRWWLGPEYDEHRGQTAPMAREAAWRWLESRRAPMLAAIRAASHRGWHDLTVQLVEAQWSLCFKGKYHDHWTEAFELGRDAAIELRDRRFEARMRCQLGFAYLELGRLDEAAAEFTGARDLDRAAGHVRGQATAVESLGLLRLRRSGAEDLPESTADPSLAAAALELLTENLTLNLTMAAEHDDDRAVALAWRHRGRALSAVGEHAEAIAHLVRARELAAAIPDRYNEARALTDLGRAHLRAGSTADAGAALRAAAELQRDDENRVERAVTLELLATAAERAGDRAGAVSCLTGALEILDGDPAGKAEALRNRLAALTGPA